MPGFTHLHVHSSYSLGIGLSTPDQICAHAKRAGFDKIALTDTNGTFGFVEFHLAARRQGIDPIYGAVVTHVSSVRPGPDRFDLTLIALSREGLRNVAALVSLSAAADAYDIASSLDQFTEYTKGVAALAGASRSEVAALALAGDDEGVCAALDHLKKLFGDDAYVALQDYEHPKAKQMAHRLHAVAASCGVKSALAEEVRYVGEGMREVHALLEGVQHPNNESDFFRVDELQTDRGMRNAADMERRGKTFPEAYDNTIAIAASIEGDLVALALDPQGWRADFNLSTEALHATCLVRLNEAFADATADEKARHREVLAAEMGEIEASGLVPTFLLHGTIMSALRQNQVPLGPSTGLNLQSLAAYLLGITSYNPYSYTPGFKPMLDRDARGMNEIEIQMSSEQREAVVATLSKAKPHFPSAYIPAVERITAARAVRMAARVAGATEDEITEVQSIISKHPGMSLKRLSEEQRQLSNLYRQSPAVRAMLLRAMHLEHLPCGFIRSRRSLAMAKTPLSDVFAHTLEGDSKDVFAQTSRDVIPVDGILRIDFTPLHALTVDYHVARSTEEQNGTAGWNHVPTDDAEAWASVQSGDTTGVFLFEGLVIQQQRDNFRLENLDDLTDFLAVLRLRSDTRSVAQRFASFKQAPIVAFVEPDEIKAVTRSTNGHVLYNEQLRELLSRLTGTNGVDALRMLNELKAATPAGLSAVRKRYMTGAADQNIELEVANYWFDRMLYYAQHAISRERVLTDALIVYKLFYLKTHKPILFYTALLNTYVANDSKLKHYVDHLTKLDLMLPIDVNRSRCDFSVESRRIRAGLRAVAGITSEKAEAIVGMRDGNVFNGVEDFAARATRHGVDRDDVKRLIRAEAFGFTGDSRKVLLARLSTVDRPPVRKVADPSQLELFDL